MVDRGTMVLARMFTSMVGKDVSVGGGGVEVWVDPSSALRAITGVERSVPS